MSCVNINSTCQVFFVGFMKLGVVKVIEGPTLNTKAPCPGNLVSYASSASHPPNPLMGG